jgi:hypothetical protein
MGSRRTHPSCKIEHFEDNEWEKVRARINKESKLKFILRVLSILWASPYTLLGLCIGMVGVCAGGHVRVRGRVIEFYGGGVKWFLQRLPGGQFTLAMTLGHTILGQTDAALDISHDHEMVHVRQYERWGPFMGPAYLICMLVLWLMGRRPYHDNPFEREAYNETDKK